MKPEDFRRLLEEDLNHGRPETDSHIVWGFAIVDLWEAAIGMRAERMRSFPGKAEAKVHEALKKLEAL